MKLKFLMLIISVIIALFIVVDAQLEKEYPPAVPPQNHQQVKSRFKPEASPINPSQFPREKKWSLYLIPAPPYGRGPSYPVPAEAYQHYPYNHPQYVLERNSYPSDDFQFYYY